MAFRRTVFVRRQRGVRMKLRKICLCIVLSACVVLNSAYVFNKVSPKEALNSGFYLSSNYVKTVNGWKLKSEADEQEVFDVSEKSITPGMEECTEAENSYKPSALSDINKLQYYYEGSNYAYGIDKEGNETIALKRGNGEKVDILSGAGSVKLYTEGKSWERKIMLSNTTVSSFSEGTENNIKYVEVLYNLSGLYTEGNSIAARYWLYDQCIKVTYNINASADEAFAPSNSYIGRTFPNGYKWELVKIASEWVYPDDLDYPYQQRDALGYITHIDSAYRLYSFIREEGTPDYIYAENQSSLRLPLYFKENNEGRLDNYTYSYTIALVDASSEKQSADYLGLFRSKCSDVAAGIAPVTKNTENSTVFIGNSVDLNLNVTNLTDSNVKFSLRYDVRNYYGEVVDKGVFIDNTVLKGLDANRVVRVSGRYGMYYLNLYVTTEKGSYTECYPFALVKEYDYKYFKTSPFGVSGINVYLPKHTDGSTDYTQYMDIASIFAKTGIANARLGAGKNEESRAAILSFADKLNEYGITQFNGQHGATNTDESAVEGYVAEVAETISVLSKYVQSFEVGNEYNLKLLSDQTASDSEAEKDNTAEYNKYYNYTFKPTYDYITEKYPDITYIPTSVSAAASGWLTQLAEEKNKIWDMFDIFSVHTYSDYRMPDSLAKTDTAIANGTSDIWSIEDSFIRAKEAVEKYGDKEIYVTEVGYNTAPENANSVGLRTQADYTVRIGALALGYGIDRIQYYCFSDRTSWFTGFDNDYMEFNFGLYYEADFYGTFKPKPAGIAFAVMTQQLESAKYNGGCIDSVYDEGNENNGVRAVRVSTDLYGDVVVAYSNREILTNGKKQKNSIAGLRTPNLPWNSQWSDTDLTEFTAMEDTVRVVDTMGNETVYTPQNGKVSIPLTGSPVYIFGI